MPEEPCAQILEACLEQGAVIVDSVASGWYWRLLILVVETGMKEMQSQEKGGEAAGGKGVIYSHHQRLIEYVAHDHAY